MAIAGYALSGVYHAATGRHSVLAAADAATVARWYLLNPVGSLKLLRFTSAEFMPGWQGSGATAHATAPRIQLERFGFTGTSSGALITDSPARTEYPASEGVLTSANTGVTISGQVGLFALFPGVLLANTAGSPRQLPATGIDWNPREAGQVVLAAGEGIMLRQPDAGTTADLRVLVSNIMWEEWIPSDLFPFPGNDQNALPHYRM